MMMTSNWIIVRKEKNFNSIPVIMNLWNWNLFCVNNQSLRTEWIVNFLIRKKMFIISIHSFNHCCCCHCQCRCWEKVPMKKSKKKNLHCKKQQQQKTRWFFFHFNVDSFGWSVGWTIFDWWKFLKMNEKVGYYSVRCSVIHTHTDWHWKWWWKLRHIKSISINGSQNFLFSSIFWIVWYF